MTDPHWFQKKWGFGDPVLIEDLYRRVVELEQRVKILEEENISTTNEIYRLENSLDSRIDIIAEHIEINHNV